MTVKKTTELSDGTILEFQANVGAKPKYLENGVPVTKDYYYDRLYLESKVTPKVSFFRKVISFFSSKNNCNLNCNQGRNCQCTDIS